MSSLEEFSDFLYEHVDESAILSDNDFWQPFFLEILKDDSHRLAVESPFGGTVKYYNAYVEDKGPDKNTKLVIVEQSKFMLIIRHHPEKLQSFLTSNPNFFQEERDAFATLKIIELFPFGAASAPNSGTLVVFLATKSVLLSNCIDSFDNSETELLDPIQALLSDLVYAHQQSIFGFSFDPRSLLVSQTEEESFKILPLCFAGGKSSIPTREFWSREYVPKAFQMAPKRPGRPSPKIPPPTPYLDIYGITKLITVLFPKSIQSLNIFLLESQSNSTISDVQGKFNEFRTTPQEPALEITNSNSVSQTSSENSTNSAAVEPPKHPPKPRLVELILQSATPIGPEGRHPKVYKVPFSIIAEEKQNKIRAVLVGPDSEVQRTEMRILVLGQTGSGKTTFLNGIANYLYGVEWNDPCRFKVITDDDEKSLASKEQTKQPMTQATSQTDHVTAYTFPWQSTFPSSVPRSVTIVDTPGFGDTRGLNRDAQTVAQFEQLFKGKGKCGLDTLDAVAFVVQSSLPRLNAAQQYIFDSILKIFGKDIVDNIIIVATFADAGEPQVLHAIRAGQIPHKYVCKFNNSALFANVEGTDGELNSFFWKIGVASYEAFFKNIQGFQTRSLVLTNQVLDERKKLQVTIDGLSKSIREGVAKMDEIQKECQVIAQHYREIAANKNFTTKVKIQKTRKINLKAGEYVTNCRVCNTTCHYPCYIPDDQDKSGCAAIGSGGYCTVCLGHCHWNCHHNMQFRWELFEEEETRTLKELYAKYGEATTKKQSAEKMVEAANEQYRKIWERTFQQMEEARNCVNRLRQIAARATPLSEIDYVELQIEAEKSRAETGWQTRVKFLEEVLGQAKLLKEIVEGNEHNVLPPRTPPKIELPPEAQGWLSRIFGG